MLNLTPHQLAAYDAIKAFVAPECKDGLMTLEGYAGTGKTTLVGQLVDEVNGQGMRVAVAAPTNKAVRVLREKIADGGPVFASIHSLLGLRLVEVDDRQECQPNGQSTLHDYQLCIVDEASMLGEGLFRNILVGRDRCKVLFVGDPAQLPPVGDVGLSPAFSLVQRKAILSEVVRQAEGNPIIRASMAVRGAIERCERVQVGEIAGCFPRPPAPACVMPGGMGTCVSTALYELGEGRDARVLAFRNETVVAINQIVHAALYGQTQLPYVPGERVMAQASFDPDGNGFPVLANSEEAEVLAIEVASHPVFKGISTANVRLRRDGGSEVTVPVPTDQDAYQRETASAWDAWRKAKAAEATGGGSRSETKSFLGRAWALRNNFAHLRHTYALTTHKSQGSTFDTAIVHLNDLAKMREDQDFNRALYVAMTRPSQFLAVVV